jgi:DNA-binding transcriptional MerR regulator
VSTETTAPLSIGRFSRLTGLSPKALRLYDGLGLLCPVEVDRDTGYRYYEQSQVDRGLAIRELRALDVPLADIGPLLAAGPEDVRRLLLEHQGRLAVRATTLQASLNRLQRLIEGKERLMSGEAVEAVDEATHRRLAVELFNGTWRLLELEERSPEQVDAMIHGAHASRFHWEASGGTRAHAARGEWQCSRVYAVLDRPEPALWHARRCLELCEAGGDGFEDWDLAGAHEAMARALLAAGKRREAARHAGLGRVILQTVEDEEDRAIVGADLDSLGL